MTAIVSMGREKGYPGCGNEYDGIRAILTYADRFRIVVDDDVHLGEEIFALLPSDYNLGEYLGQIARLKSRKLKRDEDNRRLWYLDLTYTTDFHSDDLTVFDTPPDLRPVEWTWDFDTIQFVLRKDAINGNPVKNSADEPIEITTDVAMPTLTVSRWQPFFSPATLGYINHTNSFPFWTAPPGTALCTGIRDQRDTSENYAGIPWRKVVCAFKFYAPYIPDILEGTKEIVMDIGNRFRPQAGANFVDARTKVKLNTDGTKRADTDTPLFLRFNKFPAANFDDLGVNIYQI
jgi:hypothetical protein